MCPFKSRRRKDDKGTDYIWVKTPIRCANLVKSPSRKQQEVQFIIGKYLLATTICLFALLRSKMEKSIAHINDYLRLGWLLVLGKAVQSGVRNVQKENHNTNKRQKT